jgi:hypothetical protein
MQGWVFFLAGIMILSREHEWVHRFVMRFNARFPKIGALMDKGQEHARRLADKMLRRFRAA